MPLTSLIIIGIVALVVIVLLVVVILSIYKVARIDQALIITGGKEPKVKIAGGGFVIPFIRKFSFFDLCMITVEAAGDEIKTTTGTPIVVNWTAQIRPNTNDSNSLLIAATSFSERGVEEIKGDVKLTLDGGVREVVAGLTPEQVLREKTQFSEAIKKSVTEEMANMGFILVSLNIQDVVDKNGYYNNLAAKDMEDKRMIAANVTAVAEQTIRQRQAESDQVAKETELKATLAIAENQRNNSLRIAGIKVEIDKANADANIAGELQKTTREKELTIQQGQVEVNRQEQANLAAQKEKEVIATRAEAEKVKMGIDAEAKSNQAKINAEAEAAVTEKIAAAEANAVRIKAEGTAKAVKAESDAAANKILLIGQAEADAIRLKGLAEADAIKAKMLAEAEGERSLADARAANDGVNFRVTIAEIEAKAKVEIAAAYASVMADLGKNARFVNFTGNGSQGSENALFSNLEQIPVLLEKLSITNQAVNPNGEDFNETLKKTITSIVGPLAVLNKQNTIVSSDLVPENKTGEISN